MTLEDPRSHSQWEAELCLNLKWVKQQNMWRNVCRFAFLMALELNIGSPNTTGGAKHWLPPHCWGSWNLHHKNHVKVGTQTMKVPGRQSAGDSCLDLVSRSRATPNWSQLQASLERMWPPVLLMRPPSPCNLHNYQQWQWRLARNSTAFQDHKDPSLLQYKIKHTGTVAITDLLLYLLL
jgi:hypothetical protein